MGFKEVLASFVLGVALGALGLWVAAGGEQRALRERYEQVVVDYRIAQSRSDRLANLLDVARGELRRLRELAGELRAEVGGLREDYSQLAQQNRELREHNQELRALEQRVRAAVGESQERARRIDRYVGELETVLRGVQTGGTDGTATSPD